MTEKSDELEPRGPRITEMDSRCLRQVHPANLQNGRLTRVAFEVKEWDKGLLSVFSDRKTTPEEAFEHYTKVLNRKSAAVYAVTVAECESEKLPVHEDPETDPVPFEAHAVIDFRQFVADKAIKKAKETRLARLAETRGPLHPLLRPTNRGSVVRLFLPPWYGGKMRTPCPASAKSDHLCSETAVEKYSRVRLRQIPSPTCCWRNLVSR